MALRRRRNNSNRGTGRKTFWVENSLDPISLAAGVSSITDMLSGVGDRDSLRRLTLSRLIITV